MDVIVLSPGKKIFQNLYCIKVTLLHLEMLMKLRTKNFKKEMLKLEIKRWWQVKGRLACLRILCHLQTTVLETASWTFSPVAMEESIALQRLALV